MYSADYFIVGFSYNLRRFSKGRDIDDLQWKLVKYFRWDEGISLFLPFIKSLKKI